MKSKSEIKKALLDNKIDLSKYTILYECAGDYVRGWVAALEWVLQDSATSQQANSADKRKSGQYYPDYFDGEIPWECDSGK